MLTENEFGKKIKKIKKKNTFFVHFAATCPLLFPSPKTHRPTNQGYEPLKFDLKKSEKLVRRKVSDRKTQKK